MMRFQSKCFQLKYGTPIFWKKAFILQKICFQVKVVKTFKISIDCHIKICQSVKRSAILKIHSTAFKRAYALLVGFKTKSYEKTISSFKTKTNPNFAVKPAERSNHSFLLSTWWITFFKHLHSLIRDNGMYRT